MSDFKSIIEEKEIEIIIPSEWSEMQSPPPSTDESPFKRPRIEQSTFQETGSSQQHLQGINGLLQLNRSLVDELMPLKTNYEKLKNFVKIFSETNSFLQNRIKNAKLLSLQLYETLDLEIQLKPPVRTDVDTPNTIHNYAINNQSNGDSSSTIISNTSSEEAVPLEKIERNILAVGIRLLDEVPPMSKHFLESSKIIESIPEPPTVVPKFIQYFAQNFNELRKDKLRAEALFSVYRIDSLIGVSVGQKDRVAHFWFWQDYSVICPVCSRIIQNNKDKHLTADHYTIVDGLRLKIRAKLNFA